MGRAGQARLQPSPAGAAPAPAHKGQQQQAIGKGFRLRRTQHPFTRHHSLPRQPQRQPSQQPGQPKAQLGRHTCHPPTPKGVTGAADHHHPCHHPQAVQHPPGQLKKQPLMGLGMVEIPIAWQPVRPDALQCEGQLVGLVGIEAIRQPHHQCHRRQQHQPPANTAPPRHSTSLIRETCRHL